VEDDADRDALVGVHAVCYPNERWARQDFVEFADRPGQIVRVIVKEDGGCVGSLLYRMSRDEARIARVAVLPEFRRLGVGSFAVRTLTAPNSPNRKKVYTARVREHDLAAQLFLRQLGFCCVDRDGGFFAREKVPIRDAAGRVVAVLVADTDGLLFRYEKGAPPRRNRASREEVQPLKS
jgi:ribosomal protein S18 acetylase RimI-like enzyme